MSAIAGDATTRAVLEAVLAGAPFGMVILDRDLAVVAESGAQARVLRADPELRDLAALVRDRAETITDGGKTCYPIRLAGEVVAIGCVLDTANQVRDQFLSVLSHELRVPLTTILLWERLLHEQTDAPQRERALAAIHQCAQSLSRLIDQVVDGSRAISGRLQIDQRSIDVERVLAAALDGCAPRLAAKALRLEQDVARVGNCLGDTARLRQAFAYLLANAADLAEPGGQITVRAEVIGADIVISVHNTGRGIGPDALARVFEPFSQLAEGLPRSDGDLGLGLATARTVLELHGGTLEATSPGPDRGATFTARIPSTQAEDAAVVPSLAGKAALAQIDVLVVDDDGHVADALKLLLEVMGATVRCEASVPTALAALAQRVPDVLLCDVRMPGEDGLTLIRRIRDAGEPLRSLRAIALSGAPQLADRAPALEAGFDTLLAKPVDVDTLVRTIGELSRRP